MTDAELVIRTRAGDPDAFGILVSRYYDACWRFAYHMTGERADAEDVLQDAFLRAYLAIGRYDERDQFRGWLFRILTNQCRNALTSRGRRTRRFVQDEIALESAPAPPLGLATGVEDAALVRALSQEDFEAAEACVHQAADDPWDALRFKQALTPYFEATTPVFAPDADADVPVITTDWVKPSRTSLGFHVSGTRGPGA